jgi:hypothetical protein
MSVGERKIDTFCEFWCNLAGAVFASNQRRNSVSLATFRKAGYRKRVFWVCSEFSVAVFRFYRKIWFVPGEILLMHDFAENC